MRDRTASMVASPSPLVSMKKEDSAPQPSCSRCEASDSTAVSLDILQLTTFSREPPRARTSRPPKRAANQEIGSHEYSKPDFREFQKIVRGSSRVVSLLDC